MRFAYASDDELVETFAQVYYEGRYTAHQYKNAGNIARQEARAVAHHFLSSPALTSYIKGKVKEGRAHLIEALSTIACKSYWSAPEIDSAAANDYARIVGEMMRIAQSALDTSTACAQMRAACPECGGTGDVHSIDGQWLGVCDCEHGEAIRSSPALTSYIKGKVEEGKAEQREVDGITLRRPRDIDEREWADDDERWFDEDSYPAEFRGSSSQNVLIAEIDGIRCVVTVEAPGYDEPLTDTICDALLCAHTPTYEGWEPNSGVNLIAAERKRHVSDEGWTPEHDDAHTQGEIAAAAACYAIESQIENMSPSLRPDLEYTHTVLWPWDLKWWKPTDRIRDLVKAGALCAAEIDRLLRAKSPNPSTEKEG